MSSARISPTAHYTGQVWCRHGLSPEELGTTTGLAMFHALRGPMLLLARGTGGITLEKILLQRHLIIDHVLERAIEAGTIGQIVEVAAGLSGRGLRLCRRHPELIYVEADLPGMATRKRELLARIRPRSASHAVVDVDALADSGPLAVAEATASRLDPARGTAIITEGLVNYFSPELVAGIWRRFAAMLSRYPSGIYVSDVHLGDPQHQTRLVRTFRALLGAVARGRIHLHGKDEAELRAKLEQAGFSRLQLHRPSDLAAKLHLPVGTGADYTSVLEAGL
jgi:O-methyltransferase involved in polyketide biosynthesis